MLRGLGSGPRVWYVGLRVKISAGMFYPSYTRPDVLGFHSRAIHITGSGYRVWSSRLGV